MKLKDKTNELDKLIGEMIKDARRGLNMSQSELAEKLGITFQQVQKYEKGTNRVALSTFCLIAVAMNVSRIELFSCIVERMLIDEIKREREESR